MPDPQDEQHDSQRQSLDYHRQDPQQKPDALLQGMGAIGGAICGIGAVIIAGLVVAGASGRAGMGGPPPPTIHYWPGVIFFGICGLLFVAFGLIAPSHRERSVFVSGFLAGAALMSLVEGLCFYNS